MRNLLMLVLVISLARLFSIYEAVDNGEPVVFNNKLYMITGGAERGLTALQITR